MGCAGRQSQHGHHSRCGNKDCKLTTNAYSLPFTWIPDELNLYSFAQAPLRHRPGHAAALALVSFLKKTLQCVCLLYRVYFLQSWVFQQAETSDAKDRVKNIHHVSGPVS